MPDQPSFSPLASAQADETTGRYIITFANGRVTEGLAALKKGAGISRLPNAAEFNDSALDLEQLQSAGGAVFPTLGIAVVTLDEDAHNSMASVRGEDAAILDIEPERSLYAMGDTAFAPS